MLFCPSLIDFPLFTIYRANHSASHSLFVALNLGLEQVLSS
jgi:hypothetical protein